MKETFRLILVLTAICLGAGLLLAYVNKLTAAPIREAERAEKLRAISRVLPEYDNQPDKDVHEASHRGRHWTFYVARQDGRVVGAAFETTSSKGYGGNITLMVGVQAGGKVKGIEILKQKETPGLGAKIQNPEFRKRFAGRSIEGTDWRVRKDGGDIDEITAATISSRAVLEAVEVGLKAYKAHAAAIGGPQQTGSNP
jgi:electron transport complex protein RnfG